MGKLYDGLQIQLKEEKYRREAEDCIKIYNKLKEMNNGKVWSSDWQSLTTVTGWIGKFPNATPVYQPSSVGYVFLKGLS